MFLNHDGTRRKYYIGLQRTSISVCILVFVVNPEDSKKRDDNDNAVA